MNRRFDFRWPEAIAIMLAALAVPVHGGAESRIEKTLKLEPGGQFVLDSDAGSVTVTGSNRSGARVVITSNRDDLEKLFHFSFEEGAQAARVTARKERGFGWPKSVSIRYEIEAPTKTSLEMRTGGGAISVYNIRGDSSLKTSGGHIEVSGLAGRLDASTSGGGIRLREVTGDARVKTSGGSIEVGSLSGSLRGNTSGGPIRVERVEGDADVGTSGGSIEIGGAGGRVAAHTSGGSVRVSFDRGDARGGELETSGGSIRVSLDPKVNLSLDASASGGGVTTNLPVTVLGRLTGSSLHGSLGSGGEMLRMRTSGGSIQIEAR